MLKDLVGVTIPRPPPSQTIIHHAPSPKQIAKRQQEVQRKLDKRRIPIPSDPDFIPQIQPDLPRPALRALFALHHDAQNFIHYDNLDIAIDTAFANANATLTHIPRTEMNLQDLEDRLQSQRQQDDLSDGLNATAESAMRKIAAGHRVHGGRSFRYDAPVLTMDRLDQIQTRAMTKTEERDLEVRAALFGMERVDKTVQPGLEAVEEHLATNVLKRTYAEKLKDVPPKAQRRKQKQPQTWRVKEVTKAKAKVPA